MQITNYGKCFIQYIMSIAYLARRKHHIDAKTAFSTKQNIISENLLHYCAAHIKKTSKPYI